MARPDRGDTARGLAGTLDELVAPLGVTRVLTGSTGLLSPVSRVVDPVLAPLGVLRPVDAVLRFVAAPLTTTLDAVIRTAGSTSPGRSDRSVSAVTPGRLHGGVIGALSAVAAASVHPRASHTVRVTSIRRSAGPPERTPGVRLGTGDLPDRPAPAPLREQPGTGTGVPAGGPGSHTEGGAFATVPSAVASSMVEVHRLLEPTDAAVLRHHAEDPTVSPD
jgi:hypothetical protein